MPSRLSDRYLSSSVFSEVSFCSSARRLLVPAKPRNGPEPCAKTERPPFPSDAFPGIYFSRTSMWQSAVWSTDKQHYNLQELLRWRLELCALKHWSTDSTDMRQLFALFTHRLESCMRSAAPTRRLTSRLTHAANRLCAPLRPSRPRSTSSASLVSSVEARSWSM